MSPLGFKARVGSLIRTWQRHVFYRFTSGVTPADLLVASMAAKLSLVHTCDQVLVGSNGRPIAPGANALPTELCWLGYRRCDRLNV